MLAEKKTVLTSSDQVKGDTPCDLTLPDLFQKAWLLWELVTSMGISVRGLLRNDGVFSPLEKGDTRCIATVFV